ncbi:MAG: AEC family transporter [Lachnospiraceae bacterium]|nr:AEC family transporter [Lachnospiraceae bacterium]
MNVTALSFRLLIMLTTGYVFGKAIGLDRAREAGRALSALVLDLLIPALVIQGMMEGLKGGVADAVGLFFFGVAFAVADFLIGLLVWHIFGRNLRSTLLRVTVMFANYAMFGFAVVQHMRGLSGLADYVIFVLPTRFLYYMLPPFLLSRAAGKMEAGRKDLLKFFCTPPVLCTFVGLFLGLIDIPLPEPVTTSISALSACCTPIGMILCGVLMSQFPIRSLFKPRYLLIPALRNMILPAFFLLVGWLLPLPARISILPLTYAAMPVSSLLPTYAVTYCGDEEVREISAAIFISTAAAIITVPMWMYIASLVL